MFVSSNIFTMHCVAAAENTIPKVIFTISMQSDFREQLKQYQLEIFDHLSEFSNNFIGTMVTQASIDRAMSQALKLIL